MWTVFPFENGPLRWPCCAERSDTQSEAGLPFRFMSTFRSKAGVEIEIVELSDNRFEELVTMYDVFEPKRGAQGLPPVGRERIERWLRDLQKHGHNLLALVNNRVIGHSMLCPVDGARAEFAIFLDQEFRNQGIGTGLTAATLAYARELNFRNVWLSVETNNRCAVRVYRKTGFQLSGLFGPEQEMDLELISKTEGGTADVSQNPSVGPAASSTKTR
jgi:RimJ/RimL family protein N-acetyltransferase